MEFKKNLKENLDSFPLIFLSVLFYISTTILHTLYHYEVVKNGNLVFIGIILLYCLIFIFEFFTIIKINDKIIFNDEIIDLKNIIYYLKNKLPVLLINLFFLLLGHYLLNKIYLIIASNFQLSKLVYMVDIIRFSLYYIVIYNIKQNLINDTIATGFIREIKQNYFLSIIGIIGLIFIIYSFNFFITISSGSFLIRFLIIIPIAILLYIYHIYLLSFE